MKRKLIELDINDYPEEYRELIEKSVVYDSSCSREARVMFIDSGVGYFLKSAPKNTLLTEAKMAEYFGKKQLTSRMISYLSLDRDWLLTERVKGEDCTYGEYLSDPERLCDTFASLLRKLHETDFSDCPVCDRLTT